VFISQFHFFFWSWQHTRHNLLPRILYDIMANEVCLMTFNPLELSSLISKGKLGYRKIDVTETNNVRVTILKLGRRKHLFHLSSASKRNRPVDWNQKNTITFVKCITWSNEDIGVLQNGKSTQFSAILYLKSCIKRLQMFFCSLGGFRPA